MASNMHWAALGAVARESARHGGPGMPGAISRFRALPRLAKSVVSGEYPGIAPTRLLMMLVAALYIVSPVDLMPEGLLSVFGLGDDAMVTAWLAMALSRETAAFIGWEKSGGKGANAPYRGQSSRHDPYEQGYATAHPRR